MLESSIYDDQESRHIALLYSKLIKSYPEFKAGLFVPDEHAGYG